METSTIQKWLCTAAMLVCCLGCGSDGDGKARDEFLAARQLAVDGKYAAAAKSLEAFVNAHPKSKYCSRAGLFLGKSYLAIDDLPKAEKWFQWTVDHHGQTLEGHKCRYKLAMCAFFDGKPDEALQQFGSLAEHPKGPLAAEATAWDRYLRNQNAQLAPPNDAAAQ